MNMAKLLGLFLAAKVMVIAMLLSGVILIATTLK
jgi:hypothetical protein